MSDEGEYLRVEVGVAEAVSGLSLKGAFIRCERKHDNIIMRTTA